MTTEQKANWIKSTEFLERNKGKIGRSAFYEAVRADAIPHIRVGNRLILVPEDAFDRMHEDQSGQGA